MLIWSSFFLLEIIIMWLCYRFIYKEKNISRCSFWDFIRKVIGYYLFMLKYRAYSVSSREMDEFLYQYSTLRYVLFKKCVFGMGLIFLLPVLTAVLAQFIKAPGASFFLYAAGMSVFFERLNRSRIDTMYLLNEGQKFLFRFGMKKKAVRLGASVKRKSRKRQKKQPGEKNILPQTVIVTLIPVCGSIAMIPVIKKAADTLRKIISGTFSARDVIALSPITVILMGVILFLYVLLWLMDGEFRKNIRKRKWYKRQSKASDETGVWVMNENREELEDWLDGIYDMCCLLHIKKVNIGVADLNGKKVISIVSREQRPAVFIGREVFTRLKKYAPSMQFDIIKLLFAHELVHIHYKDTKWMKKVYGIALLYIAFSLAVLGVAIRMRSNFLLGIAVFLLLIYFVVHRVFDERYWQQVREFRADRIGMAISNTTPAILEEALRCTAETEIKDANDRGFFNRMYQGWIEQKVHPDAERRIYEAKRGQKWCITEYFRYLWLINTGKGWQI